MTIEEARKELSSTNPGSMVQILKAGMSENALLFEMLAAQTFSAESTGSLLAKKREVDFLLRVAGTTQIALALRDVGTRGGERFLAVVASRSELKSPSALSHYELKRNPLSGPEMDRIERAAILNAEKG